MSDSTSLIPKEQAIAFIKQSPKTGAPSVNIALFIASTALHGKSSFNNTDYDLHYLRVAMDNTHSIDKIVIGILHDVIEDSDWTLDDLRAVGFSTRVVNGVDGLTKRKSQGESYFSFIERCSHNPDAIDIKLADLQDNMDVSRYASFPNDWQSLKQKAYIVAYNYLVGVKKGTITPGSPIEDFMGSHDNFKHYRPLCDIFKSKANKDGQTAETILKNQIQARAATPK